MAYSELLPITENEQVVHGQNLQILRFEIKSLTFTLISSSAILCGTNYLLPLKIQPTLKLHVISQVKGYVS